MKEIYVVYDYRYASVISVPDYIDENAYKCVRPFEKWVARTIWENPKLKKDKRYGSRDITVFVEYLNKFQVKEGDKVFIVKDYVELPDDPKDYPKDKTLLYF